LADVHLPNEVRFTQYVFRMRRCAMTVVLDDPGERVLLMLRHRFIVDRWVWDCQAAMSMTAKTRPLPRRARLRRKPAGAPGTWRMCCHASR